MPSFVSTNGRVELNGVDHSPDIRSFELEDGRDLKPATAHGDTGNRRRSGLADWTLTIEAYSNEAAARIKALLYPLLGTEFTVKVREVNAAITATNPEYRGGGMIQSIRAAGGAVGEMAMTPITIVCSDGVALIRATAP